MAHLRQPIRGTQPLRVRFRSARYARLRSTSPAGVGEEQPESNLQKGSYTGTTIEGGTVIKYSKIIWGSVYPGLLAVGPVVCKTSPFRPAIFTACDDDTVGEKISGSTGTPGWDRYGEFALRIYNASGIKLENMRFYNGHCTLSIDGSASNSVVNMQFFKCAWPIVNTYAADLGCYNVLIQDVHPGGYSFDRWGTTPRS